MGKYVISILFFIVLISHIVNTILKKTGKNETASRIEKSVEKYLFVFALILILLAVIVLILKLFDITFLETSLKLYW